jgi:spore coat protein U-like protein
MKKLLIAGALSSVISAPAFAASSDTVNFQVTATVPEECSIEQVDTLAFGNISINTSPGENALIVLNSSNNPSDTVWASCNTQARLTLTSANQALVSPSNAGNSDADFTNRINYRLKVDTTDGTAPNPLLITQDDATVFEDSVGAFHDQIVVTASIRNGDNADTTRPLAGTDYADTATITIAAI